VVTRLLGLPLLGGKIHEHRSDLITAADSHARFATYLLPCCDAVGSTDTLRQKLAALARIGPYIADAILKAGPLLPLTLTSPGPKS
jgi:hypothetical protein